MPVARAYNRKGELVAVAELQNLGPCIEGKSKLMSADPITEVKIGDEVWWTGSMWGSPGEPFVFAIGKDSDLKSEYRVLAIKAVWDELCRKHDAPAGYKYGGLL